MAVLVVSLALPLVASATAHADTAYVTGTGSNTVVHLDAVNAWYHGVYVYEPTSGTFGLQDSGGNTVTPGAGCVRPAADVTNYVECTAPAARLEVQLGPLTNEFKAGVISVPVVVHGGDGPDQFSGYDEDDTFYGEGGDDTFWSYWANKLDSDVFWGGPGHDKVSYWARNVPIQASIDGVANDGRAGETENIEPDVEEVDGGQAGDTLVGSSGDDVLFGDAGSDTLYGQGGNDTLTAGNWGCGDTDRLYGGGGNDRLESRGSVYVDGGSGNDTLEAGGCVNGKQYVGGPGNDTILLPWSRGPWVARLDDIDNDGPPNSGDNYHSDIENVKGGDGPDLIVGNAGSNQLDGGPGDDTIDGGGGADVINGGDGEDVADYSSRAVNLSVSLDGTANDGASGEKDNVEPDVEDIWGGSGNDRLVGNELDNAIDGGLGADQIVGGDGIDAVDYSLRTADLSVSLDGKANDGEPGEDDAVGTDVEDIWGGAGDDYLTGDAGDNVIDGGLGADHIVGGAGFDGADYSTRTTPITADLDGSEGDDGAPGEHDTLAADLEGIFGGSGADTLSDNAGDGWLVGGPGDDRLNGQAGEDFFEGDEGDDSIFSQDGMVDAISCGYGTDTAHADQDDVFADYGCEHVDLPDVVEPPVVAPPAKQDPAAKQAAPAPPPPALAPVDRTAPQGSMKLVADARLRGGLRRGVTVQVTCSEDCSARATIKAIGSTARYFHRHGLRGNLVGGASSAFGHGDKRSLRVRLSKQAREAVGRLRTGRFELDVTLTDARGNSSTLRRTVQLPLH